MANRILLAATGALLGMTAISYAQDAQFWYRQPMAGLTATDAPAPPSNTAPEITGVDATLSASPGDSVMPFSTASVTDPDASDVLAATLVIDTPDAGAASIAGGFLQEAPGRYSLSAPTAVVSAAIRSLVFSPHEGRLYPGSSEEIRFSLQVTDTSGASVAATATLTVTAPVNDVPVISGLPSGLAVMAGETVAPFTSVLIADPEDDVVTLTITLDSSAKGSLSPLTWFGRSGNVYTATAAPGAATTAIRELVFTPGEGRLMPGESEIVQFDLRAQDAFGFSTTETMSLTVSAPPNDPPVIAGLPSGLTVEVGDAIAPFATVSISDAQDDIVTVAVSLDDPAQGTLSSLGGFSSAGSGIYTLSASPAVATTSLQGLVFTPATGRLNPEESEIVSFTLTAADDHDFVTETVTLTATEPAAPEVSCEGDPEIGTICSDGAIYAGIAKNGHRIFAAPSDAGLLPLKVTATATPSTNNWDDGIPNTNAMFTAGLADHPAAQACRSMGPGWYVPASTELRLLYDNLLRAKVVDGVSLYGFAQPGGEVLYWSSTSTGDGTNGLRTNFQNWTGTQTTAPITNSHYVRCVRR